MKLIVIFAICLLPLYGIGAFFGSKYLSQSHLLGALVASLYLLHVIRSGLTVRKRDVSWTYPFLLFLFFGVIGLILSPHRQSSWSKGGIQLVGISIMLLMSMGVLSCLKTPVVAQYFTRVMMYSLAIFASIGIAQFFFWNILGFESVLRFYFLNDLAGGTVWADGGTMGGLARVNSLALEPSHMARYLCLGAGPALVRIGVLGRTLASHISHVVPFGVALTVLCGFVVAMSLLGWIILIVVILSLWWLLEGRRTARKSLRQIVVGTILVNCFLVISMVSEGALNDKLRTISLIASRDALLDSSSEHRLSALALAANLDVTIDNISQDHLLGGGLGSHPIAYEMYAPVYSGAAPVLEGLNAGGAGSLFLRLLSETGLIGSSLFIVGCLMILANAKKWIALGSARIPPAERVLFMAHAASFGGMLAVYFLRTGQYYDPVFWVSASLAVAGPVVISAELGAGTRAFPARYTAAAMGTKNSVASNAQAIPW